MVFSSFTAVTTFYLAIRDWSGFGSINYFWTFILIGICFAGFFLPTIWFVGRYDYKRGMYKQESMILTEQNPYNCDTFTPKEQNYILPMSLLAAKLAIGAYRHLDTYFKFPDPVLQTMNELDTAKSAIENRLKFLREGV